MRELWKGTTATGKPARVVLRSGEDSVFTTSEVWENQKWNELIMGEFACSYILEQALIECTRGLDELKEQFPYK